ncbi:MAG: hypothetical protein ACI81W_004193, partial [Saprospiraceae bacterium]
TDIAEQIMQGAAYLYRIQSLKMQGVEFPLSMESYVPEARNLVAV